MTEILGRSSSAQARLRVRQLYDRREIDAALSEDRAYAAYALSHLELGLFERTQFWIAEGPGTDGLVVRSNVVGESLTTFGDPEAIEAILSLHPGPRAGYLSTAEPDHIPVIERWHHVDDRLAMRRMTVTRATFTPMEGAAQRLGGWDVAAINALYALDDRPSHYSGRQIENAVYFGVYAGDRLVAVAGTHVVSPMASTGVVGNVLTHPAYRGRGLARLVTSKVTAAILDMGCALVVLTADPLNTPAIRAYASLGYAPGAAVIEARLRRREQLGIGAWWRRRHAERANGYETVLAPVAPGRRRLPMTTETRPTSTDFDVADPGLAAAGLQRIDWAAREMPVIRQIRARFLKEKPLAGVRMALCLHVTSETANLVLTLRDGGADIRLAASNPLSTQDEVAAALAVTHGIPTFAIKGEDTATYFRHLHAVIAQGPQITMDDGADVVALLHTDRRDLLPGVVGGTEETTTGVVRLRALAAEGKLAYPIIAVNDAETKHYFDNRYGTGQSTLDGITRATNILYAGKTIVVCGYGWCGRGVASRARGMGAQVVVTEVSPLAALEAVMDGFQVMPIVDAARIGDIFITVTGDINVIDEPSFAAMKSGAILANSGHFDAEINLKTLAALSETKKGLRPFVEEYTLGDGRTIVVLAEGRLVNLGAAEGHPASVMDMSFANQALCAEYMVREHGNLTPAVYDVPRDIDNDVARLKLEAMGVSIDTLTAEQAHYLSSWELGTH